MGVHWSHRGVSRGALIARVGAAEVAVRMGFDAALLRAVVDASARTARRTMREPDRPRSLA
jgi:hypothetical protein